MASHGTIPDTNSHGDFGDAQLAQMFHALDPSRFPATVAVADSLPVPFEDECAFGLDLLVDGLAQALRRAQKHGG